MIEQVLQKQYTEFLEIRSWSLNEQYPDNTTESDKRLAFLVDHVLDLTTYCEDYSIQIGTKLLDVLKYLTRNTKLNLKSNYNYSTNNTLEFTYCLMIQHLMEWINWGTNIYTAWLDKISLATGHYMTEQNDYVTTYTEFTSDADILYFINFIDNKV